MTIKIEIDSTEARKFLKEKGINVNKRIKEAIRIITPFIHGEVKESIAGRRNEPTSVDTGRFLNSVEFETSDNDAVIFTQIPYAKFLEYGTTKMMARRHFNNTKERNKEKIKSIFEEKIKDI